MKVRRIKLTETVMMYVLYRSVLKQLSFTSAKYPASGDSQNRADDNPNITNATFMGSSCKVEDG